MINKGSILAFIYLMFTVLVNIQAVDVCTTTSNAAYNCCCAASGGCNEDMTCCANAPEDDSTPNEHQAIAQQEIIVFLAAPSNSCNVKISTQSTFCAGFVFTKPPPKQKLFIAFHQLVLYA